MHPSKTPTTAHNSRTRKRIPYVRAHARPPPRPAWPAAALSVRSYYFYGDNTTSIKAVLKSADLVDIDDITAQVCAMADR